VTNPDFTRVLTSDSTPYGAIAQSGLTYDGQYLTIYGGQRIKTQTTTPVTTTGVTVASVAVSSGSSAHFEYLVIDGINYRAGVVMCVWDGVTTAYTDTSTPDIGITLPLTFSVSISGGNVNLIANASSGSWTIKVGTRVIF
jgi:hypothetical protein